MTFLSLDVESTGTNVTRDRIIQIGLVSGTLWNGEIKVEFVGNHLVHPGMPIPSESTAIHGITDDRVKDRPTFESVARHVAEAIHEAHLIIGFNLLNFDLPIISEECARFGVELVVDLKKVVDAGNIFKKMNPRTLEAAVARYAPYTPLNAHDAASDALATAAVLEGQMREYGLTGLDASQLASFSHLDTRVDLAGKLVRREDGVVCYNIGRSKGVAIKDDISQAYWMIERDFPCDTKSILTEELKRLREAAIATVEVKEGDDTPW